MDKNIAKKLEEMYNGFVDEVDSWVCGICEKHVPGSSLVSLFQKIVRDEFERLRNADRFYFERPGYFSDEQLDKLEIAKKLVGSKEEFSVIFADSIERNAKLSRAEITENPLKPKKETVTNPVESYVPQNNLWNCPDCELVKP